MGTFDSQFMTSPCNSNPHLEGPGTAVSWPPDEGRLDAFQRLDEVFYLLYLAFERIDPTAESLESGKTNTDKRQGGPECGHVAAFLSYLLFPVNTSLLHLA